MMRRAIATLLLTLPALAACGSGSSTSPDNSFVVSVSLYPIAEIVQRVGGSAVEVVNLTPPGTDAHDVELTAKQVQRLEESDVVFYFGDNFQPGTEKAIKNLTAVPAVDLFESVELLDTTLGEFGVHNHETDGEHSAEEKNSAEEYDPHVWLDPANMIAMTKTVTATLKELQPEKTDDFAVNSTAYIAELSELGEFLDSSIGIPPGEVGTRCNVGNLYTAHQGFTYLAQRAGLLLTPIAGVNPEEQVSAQYLESLAEVLAGKDVTIFYESLIPSSAAEALVQTLKVKTDVLNPLEGLSQEDIDNGVTYISAQRENIRKIEKGLRCS
jgi:zinc transport system substrate-binding protein